MALIEGGESALQAQVLIVLRDGAAASAEARSVIERLLERVRGVCRDAARETPREAYLAHVHDRAALRGLVAEAGGVADLQALRGGEGRSGRRAIGLAQDIERGALGADIFEL